MRCLFHLIFACLFLIPSLFLFPPSLLAKPKILAADRVKDGQKIDLKQEKYQILFQGLIHEHQLTQSELDTLFHNVRIKRKAEFFRKQLLQFLILYKENNYQPLSIKGSYAGAFGTCRIHPIQKLHT